MVTYRKQPPEFQKVADKTAELLALLLEADVTITIKKGIRSHTAETLHDWACNRQCSEDVTN